MTAAMRTYGRVSYDLKHDQWRIEEVEPHVAIRLKQLFPRIPKEKSAPFRLQGTSDMAADLEWFMTRYPMDLSKADRKRLRSQSKQFFDDQAEAERILTPKAKPLHRGGLLPGQVQRDYQAVATNLVEQVRSLMLIDDIGLGKTYEGLAVGLIPGSLPMVVVVEPHLQKQWEEKAKSYIDLRVHSVKGTKPYNLPDDADIFIVKYTQLSGWVDVLSQGWVKAIVFDEVQQLRRGTESAKGTAAAAICNNVEIRVGMTATTIYNYGIEIFNIADMIRPGCLGTRSEFIREWCTTDNAGKGIVKDPSALGMYLREIHMVLRRSKADVGQEARQLKPDLQWVEPNQKMVEDSEDLAASLAMTALTGDFKSAGAASRDFDMKMREMTGIAKARSVAAYVKMVVESGQKVLLFGWHREVYRIWAEELADLNVSWYTGSESPAQKAQSKEDFINGDAQVLVMSLRSGAGTDGIQHCCSTVIFGELDWSPQIHKQCVGRLDRDGQLEEVFVIYVVTNYGSDPVIIDMQGLKSGQNQGIADPGKDEGSHQQAPDRIKTLAKSYLKSQGYKVPARPENVASVGEQVALL
jgi:SNF2 family DNA or RNA helicase